MKVKTLLKCISEHGWKRTIIKVICRFFHIEYALPLASSTLVDVGESYGFAVEQEKIPLSSDDYHRYENDVIYLNWIIPEPGIGSGGHINIFRFVCMLQKKGVKNRIYFDRPSYEWTDSEAGAFLRANFALDPDEIEVFGSTNGMKFAHATIATGWATAYSVNNFDNTISKFYFVQDYEPFFYPVGSEYFLAENTYRMGFRGITAGEWLGKKLRSEFGMKTTSFSFSYDQKIYKAYDKNDNKHRVFFYARPVTPRRSFELGILTLTELSKRVEDLEVVFAGQDISNYYIPFQHKNLGVLPESELSLIYSQCDMCLVVSGTNLSLLPLEIMASNSTVVINYGENNEWMMNNEIVILTPTDPIQTAEKMDYYFKHRDELVSIRKNGMRFAQQTSWEKEGDKVYNAIINGIEEDSRCIKRKLKE